jgi:hypothetical protein
VLCLLVRILPARTCCFSKKKDKTNCF